MGYVVVYDYGTPSDPREKDGSIPSHTAIEGSNGYLVRPSGEHQELKMRNNFRVVERLALPAVTCHPSAVLAALLTHVAPDTFPWRGATRNVRSSADHRRSVD